MLYLVSVLHPFSLGFAVLSQTLGEWVEQKFTGLGKIFDPALMLLVIIALLGWFSDPVLPILVLGLHVFSILAFGVFSRKLLYSTLLAGTVSAFVLVAYPDHLPFVQRLDLVSRLTYNLAPEIQSELGAEGDEVAEFVRQNTPEESVFLTPPTWGQFRLLARRAIVVDFKAFPFADIAMAEWHERIIRCYEKPVKMGLAMTDELEENYRNIRDDVLLDLQEEYQISYAVLYTQTPTSFEAVFQNNQYKVIRLGENSVSDTFIPTSASAASLR